jgi:hypothetical protein
MTTQSRDTERTQRDDVRRAVGATAPLEDLMVRADVVRGDMGRDAAATDVAALVADIAGSAAGSAVGAIA